MWGGILAAQMWDGGAEAAMLLAGHRGSPKAGVPVGRRDVYFKYYISASWVILPILKWGPVMRFVLRTHLSWMIDVGLSPQLYCPRSCLNYGSTAVDICLKLIYWKEKISPAHESWESSRHWSFILMKPAITQWAIIWIVMSRVSASVHVHCCRLEFCILGWR